MSTSNDRMPDAIDGACTKIRTGDERAGQIAELLENRVAGPLGGLFRQMIIELMRGASAATAAMENEVAATARAAEDFFQQGAAELAAATDGTANPDALFARRSAQNAYNIVVGTADPRGGSTVTERTVLLWQKLGGLDDRLADLLEAVGEIDALAGDLGGDYHFAAAVRKDAIDAAAVYKQAVGFGDS